MNKKDLFDFNEDNLPNITLDKKQIENIRTSLFKNIKRFNERNAKLPIDNSLENIKAIEDKLGSLKEDTIHGVKHSRVLKELALQAVHKDCPLKNLILYTRIFLILDMEWKNQLQLFNNYTLVFTAIFLLLKMH